MSLFQGRVACWIYPLQGPNTDGVGVGVGGRGKLRYWPRYTPDSCDDSTSGDFLPTVKLVTSKLGELQEGRSGKNHLPLINSDFSSSLTRNTTSHSMKSFP